MRPVEDDRDGAGRGVRSANDLLKARWSAQVAWSIVAAVALHAAVFAFWPAWNVKVTERVDEPDSTPLELIALPAGLEARQDAGTRAVLVRAIPDSLPLPAADDTGADGPDEETASLARALRDRLRRAGGLVPTVVEPEPLSEPPREDATGQHSDDPDIPGEASSTAELATLPDPTQLDLDRLSAVRPELALTLPSSWVLIRNPTEVERFMRRSYSRGDLDPDDSGLVSVALWIDERGSVEWAEIDESSGRPAMDQVALELFSQVVAFRPALDEGVPVSRSVIFQVRFPWRYRR